MRILITGGAGFIGSNLVRYINRKSEHVSVVVLDNLSTGYDYNLDRTGAQLVVGSVTDPGAVADAARGCDAIVHLGALGSVPRSVADPIASHSANLTGTLNVLEVARKARAHVVFASSSSVYGANAKLPKSEFDWVRPMSPYAVSKLGAEAYVLAYGYSYDLPTLAFRFFNVYGPRQAPGHAYAAVVPSFLDAALRGAPLVVHGDGLQSRDFTHVDTVCATLWSAVERKLSLPDPINLAFGTRTTLLELIAEIESQLGKTLPVTHVDSRIGDVTASQSDGLRMAEHFPAVIPVGLPEGIASTLEWFRQR